MAGITSHIGTVVPFLEDNINTDVIIPSREMRRVSKIGLADGLFANIRYSKGRTPNPDFALNQRPNATVLLAGRNFGCGSSREHAVWALKDYGFRAVIAESFGAIFFANCVTNGIVPVRLDKMDRLKSWVTERATAEVIVDLENMRVFGGEFEAPFDLSEAHRDMLMQGHSPIDVTLKDKTDLSAFEARDRAARPWIYNLPD